MARGCVGSKIVRAWLELSSGDILVGSLSVTDDGASAGESAHGQCIRTGSLLKDLDMPTSSMLAT